MRVPGNLKIKNQYKKYILREMAIHIGISKEIAFRRKKAAQYGSGFDKIMKKIAREKDMKQKREYVAYLKSSTCQ